METKILYRILSVLTFTSLFLLIFTNTPIADQLKSYKVDGIDLTDFVSRIKLFFNFSILSALSIAAPLINTVLILAGYFYVKYSSPSMYWCLLFTLILMGCTGKIITDNMKFHDDLISGFMNAIPENTDTSDDDTTAVENSETPLTSSYSVGFYFLVSCLILQAIMCAIIIYLGYIQNGNLDSLQYDPFSKGESATEVDIKIKYGVIILLFLSFVFLFSMTTSAANQIATITVPDETVPFEMRVYNKEYTLETKNEPATKDYCQNEVYTSFSCKNKNSLNFISDAAIIFNVGLVFVGFYFLKSDRLSINCSMILVLILMSCTIGIIVEQMLLIKNQKGFLGFAVGSQISFFLIHQMSIAFYFTITALVFQTIAVGILGVIAYGEGLLITLNNYFININFVHIVLLVFAFTSLGLLIAINTSSADKFAEVKSPNIFGYEVKLNKNGMMLTATSSGLDLSEVFEDIQVNIKYCEKPGQKLDASHTEETGSYVDQFEAFYSNKTTCTKSKFLNAFSITAVVLNCLLILVGLIFIIYKSSIYAYIILVFFLMGSTSAIIAQQILIANDVVFFYNNEVSEFSASYQFNTGFYFTMTALVFQAIVVGILGLIAYGGEISLTTFISSIKQKILFSTSCFHN